MAEPLKKFDPVKLIGTALTYVKHVRLMLLMLALGLLMGIGYFLYTTPLYRAQSLISCQIFGTSVSTEGLPTGPSNHLAMRALIARLDSQQVRVAVARRLGLIGEMATYEAVLEHIPSVRIAAVNGQNLNIDVQAYDPEVVRNYAQALVEEFQTLQTTDWNRFRDEALQRYAEEIRQIDEKVDENQSSLALIEREKKFTEATIEQQSLLQIPRDIVITRERIARMDALRETLRSYETRPPGENRTLAILSLLSNFEKETEVSVGDLVPREENNAPSPVQRSKTGAPSELNVVVPSEVDGLEPWRQLERQKRLVEAEIQEASATYLPDHPKMRALAENLENARRALDAEMEVLVGKFDLEYARLVEKLGKLEERLPEYQKLTGEFGEVSRSYGMIERTRSMWDQAREALAGRLTRLNFIEDVDWVQLQFLGHTSLRDVVPISPNKGRLVMLALMIGIAGALGLPTLLNLLDTTANSLPQLEETLGMKGIGIVPLTDPELLEAVHRSPAQGATVPNFLLECFRVIRANIGLDASLTGKKGASQVILVTSARPSEGKTTQAANLAWAYHSMGERVLVIDCDLRRGRQHKLLKLDNSGGMSRMLVGDIPVAEAIVKTAEGSFDAIMRGPIIPGSTELLCQENFARLIQALRHRYDRIILDCPPVLGLSESASLQRLADGVVLVVLSESTSTKDVRDAVALLEKAGAHFYGFVLNRVDLSKIGNHYYYYYYSSPYYDQFDEDPEEESPAAQPAAAAESAPAAGPPSSDSGDFLGFPLEEGAQGPREEERGRSRRTLPV